ncbi:MAG TPA: nitroreductase family protein [Candidatus Cloacimonadota bacterium]|nr:nitroreductase family protein [Candidatus Cloacimonadota bacterium]
MKVRPNYQFPLHELIENRWSPRAFSDHMLSREQVLTLLEAARWAASCNNEQPWRFIWSLRDSSELYRKLLDCLLPGNQEWAATAPLLMLTLVQTDFTATGKPNRWAAHDLGLAIGNLTTQATAMDIYVHNMAGFSTPKVKEHFDLPENLEAMTMIAIGYLGDPQILSEYNRKRELEIQQRKPMTDLIPISS